ncbi:MAG: hypothetical protein VB141_12930 [Burkholderia gladioli]
MLSLGHFQRAADNSADPVLALAQANKAVSEWTGTRHRQLGLDIVREQIIGVLNGPGAYGIYGTNLVEPAANTVLSDEQWAHCKGITLTIAGVAHG